MYRISVTTLEKFRRYMASVSSFDSEESLLQSIKGIFKGNPKTEFGSAYHAILEGNYKVCLDGIIWARGMHFTPEQAAPAIGYRARHSQITSEVTVSKVYETKYFPIQVSGRVDALEGLCIRDSKTKFRQPDFTEYMDSCQWKFYLDMLQADCFFYDVFEIKGFDDDSEAPYGNVKAQSLFFPNVKVCEVKSIGCSSYRNMNNELTELLNDFIGYIQNRNLWQHMKPALNNITILD